MIAWKRPLGLDALIGVLLVAGAMTLALGWMVWKRVSLLETGTEILLKTAPVDPRDLLRGYYVQLAYDIGRIDVDKLPEGAMAAVGDGFRRGQKIYLRLQPDADGFWAPVALLRQMPLAAAGSAVIAGRVLYNACLQPIRRTEPRCVVSLHFGIEKFFTNQRRAQELETWNRDAPTPPTDQRLWQLRERERALMEARQKMPGADRDQEETKRSRDLKQLLDEELADIEAQIAALERTQSDTGPQRQERFSVIARVSPTTGEAAIAGLLLDGQRIYEERLF